MNNNAEPRSFPFSIQGSLTTPRCISKGIKFESKCYSPLFDVLFISLFCCCSCGICQKLLSCNSMALSLHGCRWTAASGCCRSRLEHSFVFICFPSVLSSHLQQGSHTSISEADGTDPGAQMLPGKLSFLSSKHLATISDHLAVMCSSLVSLNEAFQ